MSCENQKRNRDDDIAGIDELIDIADEQVAVKKTKEEAYYSNLQLIAEIAKNGFDAQNWDEVRSIFRERCNEVLEKTYASRGFVGPITQNFDSRRNEILELLDGFADAPPFTIQRFAELLIDADRQYKTTHKLLNGMEKVLAVRATISDFR